MQPEQPCVESVDGNFRIFHHVQSCRHDVHIGILPSCEWQILKIKIIIGLFIHRLKNSERWAHTIISLKIFLHEKEINKSLQRLLYLQFTYIHILLNDYHTMLVLLVSHKQRLNTAYQWDKVNQGVTIKSKMKKVSMSRLVWNRTPPAMSKSLSVKSCKTLLLFISTF